MIKTEVVEIKGRQFRCTYSDENKYVVRDGKKYDKAYDPIEFERTYTEGDLIPDEEATEEELAEAGRIMMAYEHN